MISESATILIVEDEQDIRELLAYNLEKEGYAIRERYRMDFTTPLQATNPFMNDRDQMYRLWLYLEKQR